MNTVTLLVLLLPGVVLVLVPESNASLSGMAPKPRLVVAVVVGAIRLQGGRPMLSAPPSLTPTDPVGLGGLAVEGLVGRPPALGPVLVQSAPCLIAVWCGLRW